MSEENPLWANCLEPTSLVMRKIECFYCGAGDPQFVLIQHLFGIKSCDLHKRIAKRDCNAYLHRNGLVTWDSALQIPCIKKLIDELDLLPNGFPVRRTNLSIDPGWKVNIKDFMYDRTFIEYREGEWTIPVIKDELQKMIKLLDLNNTIIMNGIHLSTEFPINLAATLITLMEGVYKKDSDEYNEAFASQGLKEPVEIPGVSKIEFEERQVRIYVPTGAIQLAPSTSSTSSSENPTNPHA
jgi:hypothetical protein